MPRQINKQLYGRANLNNQSAIEGVIRTSTGNGSIQNLKLQNGDSFAILSASADGTLSVSSSSGYVGYHGSDSGYGLNLPNSTLHNKGAIRANSYETYSSIRFKENIKPIENAVNLVESINGVRYTWKDSNREDIGFIAEHIGKSIPEIVKWEENGLDAIGLDYTRISSILVEAIKDQQKQIDELKKEVLFLKEQKK